MFFQVLEGSGLVHPARYTTYLAIGLVSAVEVQLSELVEVSFDDRPSSGVEATEYPTRARKT